MAQGALTQADKKELFRLLGHLVANIHRLPYDQVRVLMTIDDRIRKNELSAGDLETLRGVETQYKAASKK